MKYITTCLAVTVDCNGQEKQKMCMCLCVCHKISKIYNLCLRYFKSNIQYVLYSNDILE